MQKAIALDKCIFFTGDKIIHKNLGYTATIKKCYSRGNALIEIPDTPQNKATWQGSKLPMTFKAINIVKHFKHQIINPKLELL
jgi:hypothetical protein